MAGQGGCLIQHNNDNMSGECENGQGVHYLTLQ